MGKVIGIDLGTTNSCVSVVENGEAVIVPSESGQRTTPSIIAFAKDGSRLVGEKAKRQRATNADRTFSSVKRHMGTDWTAKVDGKTYRPQTISAMLLRQLRKDAEEFTGGEVQDAVITVPAYFNDTQRQATRDAGTIAGLNVLRIINEPTSAALSYGLDHAEPQKVMVYDLGGGTFDVSVIDISEGIIEVMATCGDNHLGGDDFDQRLTDRLMERFRKETGIDLSRDFTAKWRVREAAEQAKMNLSSAETAQIELPYITTGKNGPVHMSYTITRAEFEDMIADLIARTEGPVRSALADAGVRTSELSKVLLVGGSTRVPAVQQMVRRLTGIEPSRNINPDECVAMGAAILGSTLGGNALMAKGTGQSLVLFDVTPMTLSIETVGGVATRLIDRNSTIPCRHEQEFTTVSPLQRTVEIKVLQGDRPLARDNKVIGKFRLSGIRRANTGMPRINVAFDIDANGILKVSARDITTGKEQSVTITADDRMSEAEIEQARRDAAENASFDEVRRDALETVNEANELLRRADQAVKDQKKTADRAQLRQVKKDIAELRKLTAKIHVEKVTEQQVTAVKDAMERLKI